MSPASSQMTTVTLPSFSALLAGPSSTSTVLPSVGPLTIATPAVIPSASSADQPVVTGWNSSSSTMTRHTHRHVSNTARPSAAEIKAASQPRHKRASNQRSHAAHPNAMTLEYNVRPYTRGTNASSSSSVQPARTQPSRVARSTHPLQGLKLDKTYPERSVEVWHEDAQRLLRPPRALTPSLATAPHTPSPHNFYPATKSPRRDTSSPSKSTGVYRTHPPSHSWSDVHPLALPPLDDPLLPQTQESASSYRRLLHQQRAPMGSTASSSHAWAESSAYAADHPSTRVSRHSPHTPPPTSRPSPPVGTTRRSSVDARAMRNSADAGYLMSAQPSSPQARKGKKSSAQLPTPLTGSSARPWEFPFPSTGIPAPSIAHPGNKITMGNLVLPSPRASLPEVTSTTLPPFFSAGTTPPRSFARSQVDVDRRTSAPDLPQGLSEQRTYTASTDDSLERTEGERASPLDPGSPMEYDHDRCMGQEPELDQSGSSHSEPTSEPTSPLSPGRAQARDPRHGSLLSRFSSTDPSGSDRDSSQTHRAIRLRLRAPSAATPAEGSSRYPSQPASSHSSSSVSMREKSSSGSTHTTLNDVKMEMEDEVETEGEVEQGPSVSLARPKRSRRSMLARTTTGAGSSLSNHAKAPSTVRSGAKDKGACKGGGHKVQRRNGEKRREQNAVAQKKFRWKKKQIAAQMEADLESAQALAESLQEQVEAKDRLLTKLQSEVGSLKRKLDRIGG